MASLVLTGDTSGAITVAAPAVAGTTTLTLPATTGTVLADTTCGVCRAWVTFQSVTSGYTIYGQFNVSSITRNATGDYTVNFTNALPNANYAALATAIGQTTTDSRGAMPLKGPFNGSPTLKTTTQCAFLYGSSSSVALFDVGYASCAFFS